jgi:predicted alpha/beta superfamily hydrolase
MQPVKQKSKIIIVAASIIVILAVISVQIKWGTFLNLVKAKPVSISASDFVPVDSNIQLVKKNARLMVIEGFHAAKLNNDRSLHIYLPPSYYRNTSKRYPVLYVQDGKSVFDISDWSKESLNMHYTADRLISSKKISEVIIVGIDNIGEMRTSEYAHWDGIDQGKPVTGKGLLYEDFVVNDVKPFIDSNFRTLSDRENTALMGASIGGFATFNIGYRNSDKFSKLAMLSPYLGWGDNRLYKELSEGAYKEKKPLKMWIDVGSKENGFVDMAAQGVSALLNNGYTYLDELAAYEVPGGEHSERFWAQRVEPVLLYFYGNIGKPKSAKLFTDKQISLSGKEAKHINAVILYDSGFKLTDIFGSYEVDNPKLLKIDNIGGAILLLSEGTTKIRFNSSSGLKAESEITVVK